MKCGGCDREIPITRAINAKQEVVEYAAPAFAIMNQADIAEDVEVAHKGVGKFHAIAVCKECHENPAHRVRPIKAHFALPDQLGPILGFAGFGNQVGASAIVK